MEPKKVLTRALSGLVYIAIVVGAILSGIYGVMCLTALFAVLGSIEFTKLADKDTGSSSLVVVIINAFICFAFSTISGILTLPNIFIIVPYLALILLFVRVLIAIFGRQENAIRSLAYSFLQYIYIGGMLSFMPLIALWSEHNSAIMLLLLFVMIWVNDTGAYIVGCSIGRHRLCERISPKKSVEGFFGGLVFCVAFAIIIFYCLPAYLHDINLWQIIFLAVMVCLAATLGDLFESAIKRSVGSKDSGSIMPGHGGILDRIDSLLFVLPIVFIILVMFSSMPHITY